YLCLLMAQPFLLAIAWAGVLAILINPMYRKVVARIGSRNAAAAIACTTAVLAVVVPVVGISIAATRSVIDLLNLDELGGGGVSAWLSSEIDLVTRWVADHVGISAGTGVNLGDLATQSANALWAQTQRLLGGVAGFFFNLVVVIFTLFFFLRDQDQVLTVIREFLPLSEDNASAEFERVQQVI